MVIDSSQWEDVLTKIKLQLSVAAVHDGISWFTRYVSLLHRQSYRPKSYRPSTTYNMT